MQITTESTMAREQFRLKYCCYKNLAEVYHAQKSYHIALEMFLQVGRYSFRFLVAIGVPSGGEEGGRLLEIMHFTNKYSISISFIPLALYSNRHTQSTTLMYIFCGNLHELH